MTGSKGDVTFKGDPLTLVGGLTEVGRPAPDAHALGNDLSEVELSGFRGKVTVVVTVPSLDTSVCDVEARRFNEEAGKLGEGVQVLVVSMDLPFAQARWCAAAGVENVQTLSDHRDASFGEGFGVLIRELRLLARTVWVLDEEGVIAYRQVVQEVTDEPDYDEVLTAVRELTSG